MFEPEFFKTEDGKLIVSRIEAHDCECEDLTCSHGKFYKMEANKNDGAGEKHIPVVGCLGNRVKVSVGSIPHPMNDEHNIGWIYLQTNIGGHRRILTAKSEPTAEFIMADGEKPTAAYAYCNLHGFWKTEI